jgi:helix-turn-helix protein
MGFKYVEAALQAAIPKTEGIDTGVVKAVLVAICQHADNTTGQCFPAIDRLARMCQHSQSSVSRAVDVLNSLKVFTHYRKGDGHICSRYAVDLKRLESWAIDWKDPSKILGTLGSQQEPWVPRRNPDFPRGTLGSQLAPNQSLNLSLNLSPVQSVKHSLASLAPPSAGCSPSSKGKAESKAPPTPQGFVSKAKTKATPPKHAPCSRCKGPTYGSPTIEGGLAFCQDCMKLPKYRRHPDPAIILDDGRSWEDEAPKVKAAAALEIQSDDPSKPYYVEPL